MNKDCAWIYLGKDRYNYKIGFTTNIKHRTRDLKTNNIQIIEYKFYNDVSVADRLEIEIHNYLDEQQVRPNKPRYLTCGGYTELVSRKKLNKIFNDQAITLDWFLEKI